MNKAIVVLCLFNYVSAQKCRALALRGGGTKGNYEVGVLQSFLEHLPPEEIQYDVVVGVSIGAVNAATIGMYEKGREKEAFATLKDYWSDLETDQIFVQWPTWGPIAGLWKNSLFDSTPTHDRINQRLKNPMRRKVSF
jgi:predicted acylesterase/phospholipase RssA